MKRCFEEIVFSIFNNNCHQKIKNFTLENGIEQADTKRNEQVIFSFLVLKT